MANTLQNTPDTGFGLTRRQALIGLGTLATSLAFSETHLIQNAYAHQQGEVKASKLTDNFHVIMGGGGNIALFSGKDSVLMVDTGLKASGANIEKAANSVGVEKVEVVVNTHWHFDHVGINEELANEGARIIAHTNTRKRLSTKQTVEFLNVTSEPSPEAALPILTFSDAFNLHLNGEEIKMQHIAEAHTDTDIIIHFAKANILHTGDLYFNGLYPFIDYSSKGWIGGMVMATKKMLEMVDDKTKIIPGHGDIATKADLKGYLDMLMSIQERVTKLIKEGKSEAEVVAAKPTANYDAKWGKGFLPPDRFAALVYRTLAKLV